MGRSTWIKTDVVLEPEVIRLLFHNQHKNPDTKQKWYLKELKERDIDHDRLNFIVENYFIFKLYWFEQ